MTFGAVVLRYVAAEMGSGDQTDCVGGGLET